MGNVQKPIGSQRNSHVKPRQDLKPERSRIDYGFDGPGFESRHGQQICIFFITFRPGLATTQSLIQWVRGFFPSGLKRPGGVITIHLHVVPSWRFRTGSRNYTHLTALFGWMKLNIWTEVCECARVLSLCICLHFLTCCSYTIRRAFLFLISANRLPI